MLNSKCPICGGIVIEQVSESIQSMAKEDIYFDTDLVYVCNNQCGFTQKNIIYPMIIAKQDPERFLVALDNCRGRIVDTGQKICWPVKEADAILAKGYWEPHTSSIDPKQVLREARDSRSGYIDEPNLFGFATSELSQDAFLCWLFEHARKESTETAGQIAKDLLMNIFNQFQELNHSFRESLEDYYLVDMEKQSHNIDVLLILESKITNERIYIVIEDKVNSGESRQDQPEFYVNTLKKLETKGYIIPVYLKTGYLSSLKETNLKERGIVYIGNQTIHRIFSHYLQRISEHIILRDWWNHFLTNHYEPIEQTFNLTIDSHWSLKEINQKVKAESLTVPLVFDKVVQVLFTELENEQYKRNTFSVQGKGHIDWHYEIHKKDWINRSHNIKICLYFIWDMNRFSLVIKSSPYKYKPKNKLSNEEYQSYMTSKKLIKNKLKDNHQLDWQFTNYYLQIGNLKDINEITIENLKEKMTRTIRLTSQELDQIFLTLENNQ